MKGWQEGSTDFAHAVGGAVLVDGGRSVRTEVGCDAAERSGLGLNGVKITS